MTGLDGINSLQKALGTLAVQESQGPEAAKAASSQPAATSVPTAARDVDQASVSSAGGLVAQLSNSSDVRSEKVAQLQAAISSGTYNVPVGAVAEKLVSHLLGQ